MAQDKVAATSTSKATSTAATAAKEQPVDRIPCPRAHVALLVVAVLPLLVSINANLNIVLTASLAVLVGSLRSVKPAPPEESMTRKVRSVATAFVSASPAAVTVTNLLSCAEKLSLWLPHTAVCYACC